MCKRNIVIAHSKVNCFLTIFCFDENQSCRLSLTIRGTAGPRRPTRSTRLREARPPYADPREQWALGCYTDV